jgi:hypothetical protein
VGSTALAGAAGLLSPRRVAAGLAGRARSGAAAAARQAGRLAIEEGVEESAYGLAYEAALTGGEGITLDYIRQYFVPDRQVTLEGYIRQNEDYPNPLAYVDAGDQGYYVHPASPDFSKVIRQNLNNYDKRLAEMAAKWQALTAGSQQ